MRETRRYLYGAAGSCGGQRAGRIPAVLIVQNDRGNRRAPTVIAVPLTASTRKPPLPTHVRLEAGEGGLRQPSIVLCEQLRTLEKTRLDRRLGRLSSKRMENVEEALRHSLDMHPCGISQEEREESNP